MTVDTMVSFDKMTIQQGRVTLQMTLSDGCEGCVPSLSQMTGQETRISMAPTQARIFDVVTGEVEEA
jgi:hypothetical protein